MVTGRDRTCGSCPGKDVFVARDRVRDGELPRFENSQNIKIQLARAWRESS